MSRVPGVPGGGGCSFIHSCIHALINRVSASLTHLSFAQHFGPTVWGKR